MLALGILVAYSAMIAAFVFAGFPTTTILTSGCAFSWMTSACALKIDPLSFRRSDLFIPGPLGLAPTNRAIFMLAFKLTWHPLKPSAWSIVPRTELSSGSAASWSSITVPLRAFSAWGSSSKVRSTSWFYPTSLPDPMRKLRTYPMFPAPPVTVTLTGSAPEGLDVSWELMLVILCMFCGIFGILDNSIIKLSLSAF